MRDGSQLKTPQLELWHQWRCVKQKCCAGINSCPLASYWGKTKGLSPIFESYVLISINSSGHIHFFSCKKSCSVRLIATNFVVLNNCYKPGRKTTKPIFDPTDGSTKGSFSRKHLWTAVKHLSCCTCRHCSFQSVETDGNCGAGVKSTGFMVSNTSCKCFTRNKILKLYSSCCEKVEQRALTHTHMHPTSAVL